MFQQYLKLILIGIVILIISVVAVNGKKLVQIKNLNNKNIPADGQMQSQSQKQETGNGPGGIKFCHDGKIYMATTAQCPGGILLKSSFQPFPQCICAHGVFLHKGSSSDSIFDGIIKNKNYKCNEHNMPTHRQKFNLFLPLTLPNSPFNETVTIIPYTKEANYLNYFQARRYGINALATAKSKTTAFHEKLAHEKIFYIGSDQYMKAHDTPEEIQIGKLCLDRKLRFTNGIYIDDLFPSTSNETSICRNKGNISDLSDINDVTHTVDVSAQKCEEQTTKFHISDPSKIFPYKKFIKNECEIPDSCRGTPYTVLDNPDLSLPEYLVSEQNQHQYQHKQTLQVQSNTLNLDEDEKDDLQRRTRQTDADNCHRILEENVQLSEYFTRLNHEQILGYDYRAADSTPFKLIEAVINVFKGAIPNKIVSHKFLDQIYKYFYYLYFDNLPKQQRTEDFSKQEKLLFPLNNCHLNLREMSFTLDESCPAKVKTFKKPISVLLADQVTVELSAKRKFDESKHDVIPETIYKLINFAYNYCAPYFDSRSKERELFKVEMQKMLLISSLQMRWRKKCSAMSKVMTYRSILPYGDLNVIMDNLDATVAAAVSQSQSPSNSSWIKRPLRAPKITTRKKRSFLSAENYEIWDGKAYCLQMKDYPDNIDPETWGILPDITRMMAP